MTEILRVYSLAGKFLYEQSRSEFYEEIQKEYINTGKTTKKVETIRCLIKNSSGKFYLQKRAKNKSQNPGMYDKTVGGHVIGTESFAVTLTKECAEELGIPATIVPIDMFDSTIKNIDTSVIAVLKEIEIVEDFVSMRKIGENIVPVHYISKIYMGIYDGSIQFIDGEVCGVETFTLQELHSDIKKFPDMFTYDLQWMVDRYL